MAGQGSRWGRVALLCGAGLLAGCATPELPETATAGGSGASFGPGYPAGSALWSAEGRVAYRTAFMAGMQDSKEGFRYDDDRGAMAIGEAERGLYRQGYRRGYYHERNVRRLENGTGGEKVQAAGPGEAFGPD